VAVRQASVLFAPLLGVLRLRERPGRPRILGALATVAGVALIALYGACDPGLSQQLGDSQAEHVASHDGLAESLEG
jgi:drug/metabolite transporter (DMT)-like permease